MKKRLLVIFIILLLTGCKVEYNLTINKDLSVHEEIKMTGTDEFFEVYSMSSRLNVIQMMLDIDDKELLDKNNYSVRVIDSDRPYVLASKNYNNIENYTNNTVFYKEYFDRLEYSKKGNILTIKTDGFYPVEMDDPERYYVRDLVLSITSPYRVVENNAMSIDENTNTYYWNINENTEDFNLLFSVDSSKDFIPNLKTYFIIGAFLLVIVLYWIVLWFRGKRKNR